MRRDPPAPAALEQARQAANVEFVRTAEVIACGFGKLTRARSQGAIHTVKDASGLPGALREKQFCLPRLLRPADQLPFPSAAG